MREVSFSKINTYLKDLVQKSTVIKDYIGISRIELQNRLVSSKLKVKDPFFVLYEYSGRLHGNKQRTFGSRELSFCILFRCKPDDVPAQEQAINLAEVYGLEFISRMKWDSTTHQHKWLAEIFSKNSVSFSSVEYEFANGLFGMEFSFELETKDPLSVDSTLWNDGKDFCKF